jgi:hypothetical protein
MKSVAQNRDCPPSAPGRSSIRHRSYEDLKALTWPTLRETRCGRLVWHLLSPLIMMLFLAATIYPAQPLHPTESQVMAAYLYNFGKFVKWQGDRLPGPDSLVICVLGKDPFGAVLDETVAGESVDARKIEVRRVSRVQDASPCSILFISTSEADRLAPILDAAQVLGALTVSDIPHFAERGGIIGFVMLQDRIRFEVNRSMAEQTHLRLSSELLKVASRIIDKVSAPS